MKMYGYYASTSVHMLVRILAEPPVNSVISTNQMMVRVVNNFNTLTNTDNISNLTFLPLVPIFIQVQLHRAYLLYKTRVYGWRKYVELVKRWTLNQEGGRGPGFT